MQKPAATHAHYSPVAAAAVGSADGCTAASSAAMAAGRSAQDAHSAAAARSATSLVAAINYRRGIGSRIMRADGSRKKNKGRRVKL
jgi:hypothetical protein